MQLPKLKGNVTKVVSPFVLMYDLYAVLVIINNLMFFLFNAQGFLVVLPWTLQDKI